MTTSVGMVAAFSTIRARSAGTTRVLRRITTSDCPGPSDGSIIGDLNTKKWNVLLRAHEVEVLEVAAGDVSPPRSLEERNLYCADVVDKKDPNHGLWGHSIHGRNLAGFKQPRVFQPLIVGFFADEDVARRDERVGVLAPKRRRDVFQFHRDALMIGGTQRYAS